MRYPLLREVAKTTEFTFSNGTRVENTNKMLDDGFEGIKTGITETAGPCLAACYKDLVIVVLNSKSMDSRWIEVKKLVKWIRSRQ
jgi:D-alanyl-D-alanine carboxypeptidase